MNNNDNVKMKKLCNSHNQRVPIAIQLEKIITQVYVYILAIDF